MADPSPPVPPPVPDELNEQVRKQRLRRDGLRPLGVNLEEAIAHSRMLYELHAAMPRAR